MSDREAQLEARKRAIEEVDVEGLEDFESPDLLAPQEADGRNDYVGGLWARYGYDEAAASSYDKRDALVTALGMCQTFVDAFAAEGRRYRVTFDAGVSTAGTDLVGQAVVITPAPVYDETLTPQRAGVILTGVSCHEASHDRYGRSTALAVRKVFGRRRVPNVLSNVLDDVRIEARFAEEYPGYRDVFEPMIAYVAAAQFKEFHPSMDDVLNLAVAAIRYDKYVAWPDDAAVLKERAWWRDWSARGAREDAPRRHVEAVREALRHIVAGQLIEEKRQERARKKAEAAAAKAMAAMSPEMRRVKEAIEALPPGVQRAMRLTAEGKRGAEVADALGVSITAAKAMIRLGRKAMAGVS